VFGHNHDTYGVYPSEETNTIFVNAALPSGLFYGLTHFPIVFDLNPNSKV
jgi:hypothetical protein